MCRRWLVLTVALFVSSLQSCNTPSRTAVPPPRGAAAVSSPAVRAPSPSPTPSPTVSALQTGGPFPTCSAPEIGTYVGAVSPLLDQIIAASQEATQLQNLPSERVAALAQAARSIREKMSNIQPPQCLEAAHLAALQAAAQLSEALEHMAAGVYPNAEAALRDSFEQSALAIALIAMQHGQRTPTPAATP